MNEVLKIEHATLRLGERMLFKDFSMRVKAGEWVCVTGESGCGKSSLLRAVMGFLSLEEGRVYIGGQEMSASTVDVLRQHTAYIPQELFVPAESVQELMRIPFQLKANRHRMYSEEALDKVWNMLGLERNLLRLRVAQLSGGQRQRIMLSTVALLGKELLLVDEPTSALDEDSVLKVIGLFRSMTESGMSIVSVTHNRVFMEACDRVIQW